MRTTIRRRLEKDLHDSLRHGVYGVRIECDERISPARLHVVPEVDRGLGR